MRKDTAAGAEFQSTLLQEERHQGLRLEVNDLDISIHAPTRGATRKQLYRNGDHNISIHAPTRGATSSPLAFTACVVDFNPRSYKRSDCLLPLN